MPRVTILINTYNYARFLDRAIDSALRQEYVGPALQILVIDDGSTDETAEVAGWYGTRIRYITKENGGQASALNLGFREAEGDVLCLMDGDDYFYPGKVQAVADVFQHCPDVGLVYNKFDIVDRTGQPLREAYPETTWTGHRVSASAVPRQLRELILLGHPWTCITSAISVRRRIVAELELPEDIFRHSPDLFLGLVLPFMTEVAIVETPGTAYVYHGANVGLFRSSAANRALYRRQVAHIRHVIEERFGARFLDYGGRSIYGPAQGEPSGISRFAAYVQECSQIAAAEVDPAIKRWSYAKLTASLLPDALYNALRNLRTTLQGWQTRQFRRKIAETGGLER